jgi:hypothetical protein
MQSGKVAGGTGNKSGQAACVTGSSIMMNTAYSMRWIIGFREDGAVIFPGCRQQTLRRQENQRGNGER